ncbi:STAS domain-containing protein [Variovorax guangxiensis]|uniref:STAS domain-containing protein n=1 Tax=Variovorax guangxiensis TaxID=1775474 RepID=A0A502DY81_9BURK|nr:STAS domain-containing protein [Variovorax guangxiensis]RZI66411.1 MAG: STAS domain-containing protein [Variovorax sp.]TPG24868.1 STAS domain-containing protein [Variovorax ginsengisoli]TPG29120.1 STAS domain-containing protein [Variovorax guangxiensis]
MKREQAALLSSLGAGEGHVIDAWLDGTGVTDSAVRRSMTVEAKEIAKALGDGLAAEGDLASLQHGGWAELRHVLETLSSSRAARGQTAGDTSRFILALKKPLFAGLQQQLAADPAALMDAIWATTTLIDQAAQYTVSTFQQAREELIKRQQEELLELSTPVIKLWDGVLAVPMIGVLDSNRTQIVMETLLQSIADTESALAIIDITGVPTVDTLVAQHLLKTVSAIRLMGADCIISGIRPQIAQTIVHLGIDLQGITTKATLADALSLALSRSGWRITREA